MPSFCHPFFWTESPQIFSLNWKVFQNRNQLVVFFQLSITWFWRGGGGDSFVHPCLFKDVALILLMFSFLCRRLCSLAPGRHPSSKSVAFQPALCFPGLLWCSSGDNCQQEHFRCHLMDLCYHSWHFPVCGPGGHGKDFPCRYGMMGSLRSKKVLNKHYASVIFPLSCSFKELRVVFCPYNKDTRLFVKKEWSAISYMENTIRISHIKGVTGTILVCCCLC